MGLDMMIYKMKKHGNCTPEDAFAVMYYVDLQEWKKEHPGQNMTMEKWCGAATPSKDAIDFYKKDPIEEVAYWRKANAIHRWFVENTQDGEDDCRYSRPLTKQDLIDLIKLCISVLKNPDLAGELLPTQAGFFFGDTDYDEWYMRSLAETIYQLAKLIKDTDFDKENLYYNALTAASRSSREEWS